jgi:hypothetical protein
MIWSRFMSNTNYSFMRGVPKRYIEGNFEPADRLAVVLVNKPADSVIQRVATAQNIAASDFQAWLRHQNAQRYEIYISMNTLKERARGRTKADIGSIRHVYLDIDENGPESLQNIFQHQELPTPSFIVNTSANKWQVIWKVKDFEKDEAEHLQRGLARETGADLAATDCARVLRLPGFYNHKYGQPYPVRMEPHSALLGNIYRPADFPRYPEGTRDACQVPNQKPSFANAAPGHLSQSERDWAFAKRALARAESEETVIAAIASYRRYDKHNPQYYAEHTVRKAAESLRAEVPQGRGENTEPDR